MTTRPGEPAAAAERDAAAAGALAAAVDRAGFAVIAAGLRECMVRPARQGAADAATLERLFLSLA